MILMVAAGEPSPLYGDGLNVRDWLDVDAHVGSICTLMDQLRPQGAPHARLITLVKTAPATTVATQSTPH